MKVWFGLVVVRRRPLVVLADSSSLVLGMFVWWCHPFVFWFLMFVSLNGFLRFNPFLDTMALRGNTPSGQTFFYGNFQGNIIGAQNHILGDNASDGSDQREDPSDGQWPYGGTPLRASPKFSSLPFLLPLPYFSPGSVLKTP